VATDPVFHAMAEIVQLVTGKIDQGTQGKVLKIFSIAQYIEEVRAVQRTSESSNELEKQEADLVATLYMVLTDTEAETEQLLWTDDIPDLGD